MGAKGSKLPFVKFDDICKERVTSAELKRLREAFKRCSSGNYVAKQVFFKEILGDSLPPELAEQIYQAFGGHNKGISFKDLVCGLVVLTRGKQEEKLKFLFALYANDSCTHIIKQDFDKALLATEGEVPSAVSHLFSQSDKVTYETFREWVTVNSEVTSVIRWLAAEPISITLTDDSETPTFYQTLAGVTHLEESEIIELERRFWILQNTAKNGLLDLDSFKVAVNPPIPEPLVKGVFLAFDENRDGHLDFKEIACGISACCRGPTVERHKFLFRVFDLDGDGVLNPEELRSMVTALLEIRREAKTDHMDVVNADPYSDLDANLTTAEILQCHASTDSVSLTQEEFLMWTLNNDLPSVFLSLLMQVCHVILGLKPATPADEGELVKGWLERDDRQGFVPGQTWYLVNCTWWRAWAEYVGIKLATSQHESHATRHHRHSSMSHSQAASASDTRLALHGDTQTDTLRSARTSARLGDANGEIPDSSNHNSRSYNLTSSKSKKKDKSHSPSPPQHRREHQRTGSNTAQLTRPSAIDNNPLVDPPRYKLGTLTNEGGRLRRGVVRSKDYELIQEPLWKALTAWYGGGTPPLPRAVISPGGEHSEPELELFPVMVRVMRHQTLAQRPTTANMSGIVGSMAVHSIAAITQQQGPPTQITRRQMTYTACFSRCHTVKQVADFMCTRLRYARDDLRLWKYIDENNLILLDNEEKMMKELDIIDDSVILVEVRNRDLTWPEELMLLAKNKNLDKKEASVEKGTTGLNNLGNTCFMNSAVQCLSHTRPLTSYFLKEIHRYELNKENPLGMKGQVAQRYAQLVTDLWSGTQKTIAPLKLRFTIGKYAPRFNGYQQHDAQELLAFLLDGLHEDLNRVHEKPYKELNDSGDRPDDDVAREAWENHLLRNRSIVVDLFHGQLKSQVRCQSCDAVSTKFDPFTFLTLPLPMENCVHVEVVVVWISGKTPTKFGLRLGMDDRYSHLKQQLAKYCELSAHLLLLAEVLGAAVRSLPQDSQKVRSSLAGSLYAFELPATPPLPTLSAQQELKEKLEARNSRNSAGYDDGLLTTTTAEEKKTTPSHSAHHSRQSSMGGSPSNGTQSLDLDHFTGFVIAMHRKMTRQEVYFISSQSNRPSLFGCPLLLPCDARTTRSDLYRTVWRHMTRLVTPSTKPAATANGSGVSTAGLTSTSAANHAQDCDDSLAYEYPFTLKMIHREGNVCAVCPWYRFCRGCEVICDDQPFDQTCCYIAIDWDPTALHLRYQTTKERSYEEHESVEEAQKKQSEPISLERCLEDFTHEEQLGDEELYYCGRCKQHRRASKRLQIWKLPPYLIIHLKRFQYLNGRWVKSNKIVEFPSVDFDPSSFVAIKDLADDVDDDAVSGHTSETREATRQRLQEQMRTRPQSFSDYGNGTYDLYSASCHTGMLGCGHYVAFARNINDTWYCYNDSGVKESTVNSIDQSTAYILMYERKGLNSEMFLPEPSGKSVALDDDEEPSSSKKMCPIQ